jgi:protein involved in polysaccharide export with SLBB domain
MKTQTLFAFVLCLLALHTRAFAQNTENTLRSGDTIVVKLSGVPAEESTVVSNTYDISDGGTINLPYIGEVRAAGSKPSTLQKSIESAYKNNEIFTHPTVQVSTNGGGKDGSNGQIVYVSGEVKASGRVTMTPAMTVHDAITSVGGPTDFANLRKVKLTRGASTRELDLRKADGPDAQIQAMPGDKIHVPQ